MGYMDGMQLGTIAGSPTAVAGSFNPAMALGGLATEAASAWYGNRMAQKRQHEAFEQQKWMMQNRYQMQVKDMMAAGLNPMLAVSQGAPMPGSVGQASVQKPDLVNAMANATVSSAQAQKTKQETENLKIENVNLQNVGYMLNEQLNKVKKEIEELDAKINVEKASESEIKRRTELMNVQAELISIQAQLGRQDIDIRRPEALASGTQAAEWAAKIKRVTDLLGSVVGTAAKIK